MPLCLPKAVNITKQMKQIFEYMYACIHNSSNVGLMVDGYLCVALDPHISLQIWTSVF